MIRAISMIDIEGAIGAAIGLLTETILAIAGLVDQPDRRSEQPFEVEL